MAMAMAMANANANASAHGGGAGDLSEFEHNVPRNEILFAADVMLKLGQAVRALPPALADQGLEFSRLSIRIAALLPSHVADGLGEGQFADLVCALEAVALAARERIVAGQMGLELLVLCRTLADGTAAARAEGQGAGADRLEQIKLAHNVVLTGIAQVARLCRHSHDSDDAASVLFRLSVDFALPHVSRALVLCAVAVLFDGARLLPKLAGMGVTGASARAIIGGIDDNAACARVVATTRWLIGVMIGGVREFFVDSNESEWRKGVVTRIEQLERLVTERLAQYFAQVTKRQPNRVIRIVLDCVAEFVEFAERGDADTMLALRLAFAFPCLVDAADLTSGLLSIWDACHTVLERQHAETQRLDAIESLLCFVFAAVVADLSSGMPRVAHVRGHFVIGHEGICLEMRRLETAWACGSDLDAARRTERVRVRGRAADSSATSARMVGTSRGVVAALATDTFREERPRDVLAQARYEAALGMAALADVLGPASGALQALRRLYAVTARSTPSFSNYECMRVPQTACEAIAWADSNWPAISGGALLLTGVLFAFTRDAFRAVLTEDWMGHDAVRDALEAFKQGTCSSSVGVMQPTEAMYLLMTWAVSASNKLCTDEARAVVEVRGPPRTVHALKNAAHFARLVYGQAGQAGLLWEHCVVGLCAQRSAARPKRKNN